MYLNARKFSFVERGQDYFQLCKPRVVALMLLTVLVGMFLATPKIVSWHLILFSLVGIGAIAGSAATINHLLDRHVDAIMTRTCKRPIANGRITTSCALFFAFVLATVGFLILKWQVNNLTAFLSVATLIGYAGVYTGYLKRATPQNIVIGGLAGALPPLLGWTAVSNDLSPYAFLLVLIIFTWTPPHFWALAIYRKEEYERANIPMLPVTHGLYYTRLNILFYTILLLIVSILPYLLGMSGLIYVCGALVYGMRFLYWSIRLYSTGLPRVAMQTFRFSIHYLMMLFLFLLVDHWYSF